MQSESIGANTNAPAGVVLGDCAIFAGEDPATTEEILRGRFGGVIQEHAFRGYLLQRRQKVTTIFSGMGTGCVEALIWELNASGRVNRLVLGGTAGLMPRARVSVEEAYVIRSARPAGSGIESLKVGREFGPRWALRRGLPTASMVSTEFYYGFSTAAADAGHPYAHTGLVSLFAESEEDMVDMETAAFYCLCGMILPRVAQYVAVKSPVNAAGMEKEEHLGRTRGALEKVAARIAELLTIS